MLHGNPQEMPGGPAPRQRAWTPQVRGGETGRAVQGRSPSVQLSFPAQSPEVGVTPTPKCAYLPFSPGWGPGLGCASLRVCVEFSEPIKGSGGPSPTAGLRTLSLGRRQLPTDQLFRPNPKHQLKVYGWGARGLQADHKRRKLNKPGSLLLFPSSRARLLWDPVKGRWPIPRPVGHCYLRASEE